MVEKWGESLELLDIVIIKENIKRYFFKWKYFDVEDSFMGRCSKLYLCSYNFLIVRIF